MRQGEIPSIFKEFFISVRLAEPRFHWRLLPLESFLFFDVQQWLPNGSNIVRVLRMSKNSTSKPGNSNPEQQQFLSLFLRSEREIFRYVAALVPNLSEVDDIVQQTAITLWEKFDAYDPNRPFTPWACRFALNKTRQWMERRKRWMTLLEDGLAEELAQRRVELQPVWESRLRCLEGCLDQLPEKSRSLIESYYFGRNGVETLANETGCSVGAIYKMLQRIRHRLQECIEKTADRKGVIS
jgi:RNA polymerase sigma-70 factor (ECF subfamily)